MELADRLPFCPRCSYPFTGLPEAHQCPECGLPYNGESRMWVGKRNRPLRRDLLYFLIPMLGVLISTTSAAFTSLVTASRLRHWNLFVVTTNVILLIALAIQWRRLRHGPSPFLATMSDGVRYRMRPGRTRFLTWNEVSDVRSSSSRTSHSLMFTKRSAWTIMIGEIFESSQEVDGAVDEMQRRSRRAVYAEPAG